MPINELRAKSGTDGGPPSAPLSERVNVLGVGVSALNLETAVAAVCQALDTGRRGYVCVTGVHGVSEAQTDPALRTILNRSLLTTPDGMPMVWMGWAQGFRAMGRVYGPDLMLRICELSRERQLKSITAELPESFWI